MLFSERDEMEKRKASSAVNSAKKRSRRLLAKRISEGVTVSVEDLHLECGSPLLTLPQEMILRIFHFSHVRDILHVAETCWLARIISTSEPIWKDKFYDAYRLSTYARGLMHGDMKKAELGLWREEIQRSMCLRLWISRYIDDPPVLGSFSPIEACYKIRRTLLVHPNFTIYSLIKTVCDELKTDEDYSMISLYPAFGLRFLRDHANSSISWIKEEGTILVDRKLGDCMETGPCQCYNIFAYVVEFLDEEKEPAYRDNIKKRKLTLISSDLAYKIEMKRILTEVRSARKFEMSFDHLKRIYNDDTKAAFLDASSDDEPVSADDEDFCVTPGNRKRKRKSED